MMDEMALKKYFGWDGSKFTGYVEMGEEGGSSKDESTALGIHNMSYVLHSSQARESLTQGIFRT